MEFGSLRDVHLPLPMEYRVYLPPCYDQFADQRYPVLYLIHGMNYNDDQWDRLGADDIADELIRKKEIHPFLIVMPRDRSWSQPEQDGFGQAVINTLIPYIDTVYRTLPDRPHRALGGLSRGASWTLHFGLTHWELFSALGMHSLPVFWADTPTCVSGWMPSRVTPYRASLWTPVTRIILSARRAGSKTCSTRRTSLMSGTFFQGIMKRPTGLRM